jgi:GNAT superfamily N-acetyltransferase
VALLYHGVRPPIVLALDRGTKQTALSELLAGVLPLLPRRFYAHLSPGVDGVLTTSFVAEHRGKHLKMALTDLSRLRQVPPAGDVLGPDDLPDLVTFYEVAYPANSFDERMLGMGPYIGIRRDGGLVAVAGVHVWSPTYRVSALGNVATHPSARGQGLATAAVAALCGRLLDTGRVRQAACRAYLSWAWPHRRSAWAIRVSSRQRSTTNTAEPTKANQKGAVTPSRAARRPPTAEPTTRPP